jgi:hypothetical protein
VVGERDGANAGQDQVLCDFVGESLDGDEEDVGVADPVRVSRVSGGRCRRGLLLLSLHAPEADLSVIEGDFI